MPELTRRKQRKREKIRINGQSTSGGKKGITLIGLKLKRSWKHTGYQHAAYCPIFAYVAMNVLVHTRVDVCVCSMVCSCVFAEAIFEVQCRIQEVLFDQTTHLHTWLR